MGSTFCSKLEHLQFSVRFAFCQLFAIFRPPPLLLGRGGGRRLDASGICGICGGAFEEASARSCGERCPGGMSGNGSFVGLGSAPQLPADDLESLQDVALACVEGDEPLTFAA